jgi:hypothetical protein
LKDLEGGYHLFGKLPSLTSFLFFIISVNFHKPMSVPYMFNIAGVFAVAHLMFPFPSMTTRLSPRGGAPQAQAHAIHTGHLGVHGAFAALQLRSRGMGVETPQHQQPSEEDDVWPPELGPCGSHFAICFSHG